MSKKISHCKIFQEAMLTEVKKFLEDTRPDRRENRISTQSPAVDLIFSLGLESQPFSVPRANVIRNAMLDTIQAEILRRPKADRHLEVIMAREAVFLAPLLEEIAESATEDAPPAVATVEELFRHYQTVASLPGAPIYDSNVIYGVAYKTEQEISAANSRRSSGIIDTTGQVVSGNPTDNSDDPFTLFASFKTVSGEKWHTQYGFIRNYTEEGREIRRAIFCLAPTPWAIAASVDPVFIRKLGKLVRLQLHDSLIHNLWNPSSRIQGAAHENFWSRMNGARNQILESQAITNNEHDAAVGYLRVFQKTGKHFPKLPKVVKGLVLELLDRNEEIFVEHSQHLALNQEDLSVAIDTRNYFVTQIIKTLSSFVMQFDQEMIDRVRPYIDENPRLRKGYPRLVQKDARERNYAFEGNTMNEILTEYRSGVLNWFGV